MKKVLPLALVLILVIGLIAWLRNAANAPAPSDTPSAAAPEPPAPPPASVRAQASGAGAVEASPAANDKPSAPVSGQGPIFNLPNGISIQAREGGFADLAATFLSTAKQGASRNFALDEVRFARGSPALSADSEKQLNDLASILRAFPTSTIRVQAKGGGDSGLSARRAEAVKIVLLDRGVAMDRVATAPAQGGEGVEVVVTKQ